MKFETCYYIITEMMFLNILFFPMLSKNGEILNKTFKDQVPI